MIYLFLPHDWKLYRRIKKGTVACIKMQTTVPFCIFCHSISICSENPWKEAFAFLVPVWSFLCCRQSCYKRWLLLMWGFQHCRQLVNLVILDRQLLLQYIITYSDIKNKNECGNPNVSYILFCISQYMSILKYDISDTYFIKAALVYPIDTQKVPLDNFTYRLWSLLGWGACGKKCRKCP